MTGLRSKLIGFRSGVWAPALLAATLAACERVGQPAPIVDHAQPMMTQQMHADAATVTYVDPPPASGVPQAAPVPRVDIQPLPAEVSRAPAVAAESGAQVAARPPVSERSPATARPATPRFVVRPKPERPARAGPQTPPPSARPAVRAAPVVPPPLDAAGFLMPVVGRVVSEFGPKPNGLANDGINIAAPRGTPVRAAEGGVVAYAGEAIRGFGRLLLLRHADGYVSAYAHNDRILVARGEAIARGQVIATVGASGGVEAPQLHFEIRQGTRPLDPRRLLAAGPP